MNAVAAIGLSVMLACGSGAGRAAAVPLPPQAACMAPALVAGPPVPPGRRPTVLVGIATWYDATMGGRQSTWYTRAGIELYGAAGPALRAVKQHYWRTSWLVLVTSTFTGKSVVVQVVDECSCIGVRRDPNDGRLIDLAPAVWHRLGVKLGVGVMAITLQVLP